MFDCWPGDPAGEIRSNGGGKSEERKVEKESREESGDKVLIKSTEYTAEFGTDLEGSRSCGQTTLKFLGKRG
ncbi:hypothetical protein RUM43_001620 [Polyplax serrata]|uniref:Uncharacterized protein n=1 Tax=Polyplax serrata TaxID=468196 RepID=A0AAN8SF14_POLSC